ncbi:hypothetical protein TWF694_009496 [Orbilia ellipsospora]|uniref:Uncharacterized protein n=1 Tax=Orbilia ellipsospora TaxID=2528407 RepID=A0AAV9XC75_9PEZI
MASTSAIVKSLPTATADHNNTVNNININNNTGPLTASEDPRSIGEQEIGLISRIREENNNYGDEEENTYNGDGTLYAADDDHNWNEPGSGGYKLESDPISGLDNPTMTFQSDPSYTSFDGNGEPAAIDQNNFNYNNDAAASAWGSPHPLTALFTPPEPDPIQRSFTAPASGFPLTLQERRLQLRNSHIRATPMASSVKPEDGNIKGLSRAAHALRTKNFTSLGRASTVSSRLSDLTASDDDRITSTRRNSSNFGSLPSIHASLRHRKTPSVEQSGYIDHLEKQISDLSLKLRSYTDPTSEKSHAAIVQRLNAKVRSLENQVSEWEALFDERIRETERINARERTSYTNQIKGLRDQIDALNLNVANLEEDLDFEKKQNTALTLAVTEKKALAMDNAQLAQALTKALGEIAELEAQAQEREEEMYNSQAKTLGQLMIDVTPKPRSIETFADISMPTGTTLDASKSALFSPMASDAAWQTLSPTTSNASTPDVPLKHRKMRKFPSGISAPKQLILSPTSSRRSSVEFNRGHSRNASSNWGSPKLERMGGGRNSLFEELERLQEDGIVANINDETVSNVGSHMPAEVSEAEQDPRERSASPPTSPTDTETSDSEDSPQTQASPASAQSRGSPSASSTKSTPSRIGSGIGYVLYSPFRVTSAVITTLGRGVLSPRSTLRDMRQRAMDQLMEVSEIEESFGSDILFGDQYDEHLRSGGQKLMQSPELRSNGSVRSTGTGLSIDLKDILDYNNSVTTSMTPPNKANGTLHRRTRRRASQHQGQVTSDDEAQIIFSGGKRDHGPRYHQGSDPNTPCRPRKKSSKHDSGQKPILPVKPRDDVQEKIRRRRTNSSHGLGIGDSRHPPPYSEYPNLRRGVKDDGWRTENSAGEISSSSEDERRREGSQGLWISESQLRAFRQEMDKGGLLKAMGISNENGMVLWTKLLMGFMVTMFVALRDGPSVALERVDGAKSAATTPVKRREIRRAE